MRNVARVMVLALAAVFLLAAAAVAQEKKIAYLNLSKLFDSYEKTKQYQTSLDSVRATYEKELKDRQAKLKEAEDKMALMKEEEKVKAQKELQDMQKSMMEFVQAKRTDLMKQEEEKTREILLEMEKVIGDFAKKEGYDLIINDRVLLYSNPAMDITDQVMKLLNESYNKK